MVRLSTLGSSIAVLAVVAFIYLAAANHDALRYITLDYEAFGALSGAILIYVGAMICGGFVWVALLRGCEQRISVHSGMGMVLVSQIGKYIPGNVAQHVSRIALARRINIPMDITLFALFVESVWVVGVGALMALFSVLAIGEDLIGVSNVPRLWFLLVVILLVVCSPVIIHGIFKKSVGWWSRRKGLPLEVFALPGFRTFVMSTALYIANYVLLGLALYVVCNKLLGESNLNIVLLTGFFAVAWVAGFLTPGAPAGIGVREITLVALLAPLYGHSTAVGAAAVLRLVSLIGDGVAFAFGLAISRWGTESGGESTAL